MGTIGYGTLTETEKYYKDLYEFEKKKNEELTAQLERFKNPLSSGEIIDESEKQYAVLLIPPIDKNKE